MSAPVCPVARMSTPIKAASRFVETASREPFGMPFTHETSSMPRPGPTMRSRRFSRRCPDPSIPGGTTPEATTAALSRPSASFAKSKTSPRVPNPRGGLEIHGGQHDNRLIDDSDMSLNGRTRFQIASMNPQVYGNIKDAGALGIVHAQEEDVRPARV